MSQQQCLVHRSSSRWPSARHPSSPLAVFRKSSKLPACAGAFKSAYGHLAAPSPARIHGCGRTSLPRRCSELPLERIRLAGIRLCGDSVVTDMTAGVCIRCRIEDQCVISSATCTRGLCGDTSGECQNGFIGFLSRCQRHARCMCCRMGLSGGRTHEISRRLINGQRFAPRM